MKIITTDASQMGWGTESAGCCFLMYFPLQHEEQEAAYSGIQSRLLED